MLMAIIMDTYGAVKSDASSSKKVWVQVWDMIIEGIATMKGQLVSQGKLLDAVEEMTIDDVNAQDLMQAVGPSLPEDQAKGLIKAAFAAEEGEVNKGVTISQAMKMVGWIRFSVQKIG